MSARWTCFIGLCTILILASIPAGAIEVVLGGMTLADLTDAQQATVEQVYGEPAGVAVTAVAAGSPAEQTCILPGDILLSVRMPDDTDYYPLEPSVEALARETWLKDVNEKTRLLILRQDEGNWVTVKALLGQSIGAEVPDGLLEGDAGKLMTYEAGKGYAFAPSDPEAVLARAPNGEALLAKDADMWGALLAWAFGTCLTEEQRRVVSTSLADSWKSATAAQVQAFSVNFRTGPKQIPGLNPQQKESARAYYANGFALITRQTPGSPLAVLVMQVADRSRQVLASAGPGVDLTQQDADAFLEYIIFQTQLATGQILRPTPEDQQRFTGEVVASFRKATPEQQQVMANMAPLWAKLRAAWDKLQADQANAIAQQWQQSYLQQAGQQGAPNAQGAYAGAGGNPQPAGTGSNMTPGTMKVLQDVMRMDHETSMTIIDNIGGGPSTDVYDNDGIFLYSY